MKVLVIDDSDIARLHIRALLVAADHTVFEQPSAIGATRAIVQNEIDVVVVDVTMPGLSGDKLVALLRQNPRLAGLLIVVISARTAAELQAIAGTSGANALLPKERIDTDLVQLLQRLEVRTRAGHRSGTRQRVGTTLLQRVR